MNAIYRSPAGGWWSRPKTWKSNTAIAALGMAVTLGAVWRVSAEKEVLHNFVFDVSVSNDFSS